VIATALWLTIAIPLALSALLALWTRAREWAVAGIALASATFSSLVSVVAIVAWIARGAPAMKDLLETFSHGGYHFSLSLALDKSAATFLMLVQFITGMVARFSRIYLHREAGFRRFFATVLLFQGAMCLLVLAGNLDLMFAGWELVGLSSFLLIAFYRERQAAARNALKTYSVYRLADVGMLLAACLQGSGGRWGHLIGLFLLLAAMGKSAQFPFSFWVARAMEGPTPSSALFYGALSVHAGAYLLLRTFPLFGGVIAVRVFVGLVGLVTAVLCSMFSRVQPTIKGQVAYASVAQVGIIFVEIALGLSWLALVHIVTNALLRCYQLLVSPSVVAHRLRQQESAGAARTGNPRPLYARLVPAHWESTLYVFALSEGYLKDILKISLWFPLRRLGALVAKGPRALLAAGAALAAFVISRHLSSDFALVAATLLVLSAIAFSACGLATWRKPIRAVLWLCGSNLLTVSAMIVGPEHDARFAAMFYGIGLVASTALNIIGLASADLGRGITSRFAGRWEVRPLAAFVALIGAIGIAGIPPWLTFWGEDLVVHATVGEVGWLVPAIPLILAINGYIAVRNFSYVFMGRASP
jgi:NADH:ubiquinone oxidoreductase subunit 5 (subunit L)/multisubunit Na+/H+ antiporter MnhA subunit